MRPVFFFKQAMEDIRANMLLHGLAVSTISLIFLLAGSFGLVYVNVAGVITSCQDNVAMMVYLEEGQTDQGAMKIRKSIELEPSVKKVMFISKAQALENLKESMKQQAGLLENLAQNPLPDAFEIFLSPGQGGWNQIEDAAARIEKIKGVDEANFGQAWLERFAVVAGAARIIALSLGSLLLVAALFITANTIRLLLHNRRDEIRIMELVGATNSFIRASFYIQGMLQGFLGGLLALGVLAVFFFALVAGAPTHELLGRFEPRFIPMWICVLGLFSSILLGMAGCHISFAQFQRD